MPGYGYMRKSVQAKELGIDVNIAKDLLSTKEVIFYGHSISKNDAHYFIEYFEALLNDNEGRHATVFTMDTSAIINLKANMGEELTDKLLDKGKIEFTRTALTKNYDLIDFSSSSVKSFDACKRDGKVITELLDRLEQNKH